MSAVTVIAVRELSTGRIKRRSEGTPDGGVSGPVDVLTELAGDAGEGREIIGCELDHPKLAGLLENVREVEGPIPPVGRKLDPPPHEE